MPSLMPQTIAALALLRADEELVKTRQRLGMSTAGLPTIDVASMAKHTGPKLLPTQHAYPPRTSYLPAQPRSTWPRWPAHGLN